MIHAPRLVSPALQTKSYSVSAVERYATYRRSYHLIRWSRENVRAREERWKGEEEEKEGKNNNIRVTGIFTGVEREWLTDLQVFLVYRVILIPRQGTETAFLPAGGQKRVVSAMVIDHVRVPARKA